MKERRIVVTGALGFLGRAIVRQAVAAGFSVTATDRMMQTRDAHIDFRLADIQEPLSLRNLCKGAACVCHVAGLAHVFSSSKTPRESFFDINVGGSVNVAKAAIDAGVQHLVFISSVSVYGDTACGVNEIAQCHPIGPYAESKYEAEKQLTRICKKSGMALTILRPATLYGEGDPGNVAHLIRTIDRGRFFWIGRGENQKSLLYVDDAARACIEVIRKPASGVMIYNIAASPHKMKHIVETIAQGLEKNAPSWHVPASFATNSAKIMKIISFNYNKFNALYSTLQKWLSDDYYNVDKFYRTFDFKTLIHLEEGINKEVAWHKFTSVE